MTTRWSRRPRVGLALALAATFIEFVGCEGGVPEETPDEGEGEGEGPTTGEGEGEGEGEGGPRCDRPTSHYPGDGWEACISDGGAYELAGDGPPSSAARVAAFEVIGDLLWRAPQAPGPAAFTDAAATYGEESGLGSRVTKRYDSHVDRPEGADCKADEAGDRWPAYCVGPARIEPLILGALEAGIAGESPSVNARTIEAALVWFYYVSAYKEATTCRDTAKDCDSSWAYYGGAQQRDTPSLGFGGIVQDIEPATHHAVFDALLGLRCWRDLDSAEVSELPELQDQALEQLDAALDRGLAATLIDRLARFSKTQGERRQAHWAFLQILGPAFDRAARGTNADTADALQAIWGGQATTTAASTATGLLNEVTPCPY